MTIYRCAIAPRRPSALPRRFARNAATRRRGANRGVGARGGDGLRGQRRQSVEPEGGGVGGANGPAPVRRRNHAVAPRGSSEAVVATRDYPQRTGKRRSEFGIVRALTAKMRNRGLLAHALEQEHRLLAADSSAVGWCLMDGGQPRALRTARMNDWQCSWRATRWPLIFVSYGPGDHLPP